MISALISRLVILAFGTLYPAYASYKAVRTKDVKEYVKWMMYWIVFALFTCAETFTDVLFSFWFPFYYELKVAIVLWLLSPATKGSSFLYKTFVHPAFLKREDEIDEMLVKAKERGYSTVMRLGSKGVTYATNVILQTAMKNMNGAGVAIPEGENGNAGGEKVPPPVEEPVQQTTPEEPVKKRRTRRGGGGLVDHIRKSYSLTDLGPRRGDRFLQDETDAGQGDDLVGGSLHFLRRMLSAPPEVHEEEEVITPKPVLRRRPAGPAPVDMKFKEVDVNVRQFRSSIGPLGDIQSTEDISSGYSSTDQLFPGQSELVLSRSFVSSRGRGRTPRATQPKRTPLTEETEDGEDDEFSYEPFYDSYPEPNPSEVPYRVPGIVRKFSGQYDEQAPFPTHPVSSQESCLLAAPEAANINGSQNSLASSSSDKSERKGKYGKLPAPPPPSEINFSVTGTVVSDSNLEQQNLTTQEGKTHNLGPKTKESFV